MSAAQRFNEWEVKLMLSHLNQKGVKWHFTTKDARIKLMRLYHLNLDIALAIGHQFSELMGN